MKCRKSKDSHDDMTNGLAGSTETNIEPEREQEKLNITDSNVNDVSNKIQNTENEPYMLPKDPLEYHGQWVCNRCNGEVDGFTIYSLVRELQVVAETIKGAVI